MTKFNLKESFELIAIRKSTGKNKRSTVTLEFSFKATMPDTMATVKTLNAVLGVYKEKLKDFKITKEEVQTGYESNKLIGE